MEKNKMSKKQFWIRFAAWAALAVGVPLVYIAVEYGIFTNKTGTSLSGWGIIALIFVIIMITLIVRQARAGLPRGSMARQCIDGYMVLIPLVGAVVLIHQAKSSMQSFERFLVVMVVCEAVAVPVNPMPRWGAENGIEESTNVIARAIGIALPKRSK